MASWEPKDDVWVEPFTVSPVDDEPWPLYEDAAPQIQRAYDRLAFQVFGSGAALESAAGRLTIERLGEAFQTALVGAETDAAAAVGGFIATYSYRDHDHFTRAGRLG